MNPWEGNCYKKLADCNSVCFAKLSSECKFGSETREDRVKEIALKYKYTGKMLQPMFFTRVRDKYSNRKLLRRLCLRKIDEDKDYLIKDCTEDAGLVARLGQKRSVTFKVEILEQRPIGKDGTLQIVPFAVKNDQNRFAPKVLERVPLTSFDDDGVNLPENLNPKFWIRIYAVGNPNRVRCVKLNCLFYVDYAGELENPSESLANTAVPGTSEVLAGPP